MELEINTKVVVKDGIATFYISHPKEQQKLSVKEKAYILAGGVALCINIESKSGNGHVLMTEIIDYLNNEFINLDSFSDSESFDDK